MDESMELSKYCTRISSGKRKKERKMVAFFHHHHPHPQLTIDSLVHRSCAHCTQVRIIALFRLVLDGSFLVSTRKMPLLLLAVAPFSLFSQATSTSTSALSSGADSGPWKHLYVHICIYAYGYNICICTHIPSIWETVPSFQ